MDIIYNILGADCAIVVYDITNRISFEQIQLFWINELKHQCFENDDGLIIIIVGNKSGYDVVMLLLI